MSRGPFAADGKRQVLVAGGSIAGLGAGVALHRSGIDVHVFERDAGALRSAGAGLVVQPELVQLVSAHGMPLPMTRCAGRRTLAPDGRVGALQRMPQQFTSWEAVHATLRAQLPAERYHRGQSVALLAQGDGRVAADVGDLGEIEADLLVAADGAQSPFRRALLPHVTSDYAGYVAWRGTVPERAMPPEIVAAFDDMFIFADAQSGGHALAYFIPGDDLGTGRGERRMNWVWYVGATAAERDTLLMTRDGQQRRASLRRGMAQDAIVTALHERATRDLHPMFAHLVAMTPDPFLQTIVDLGVPRTVFNRVVLIGDAAFVVRPHTAGGAAKAARDALSLAQALAASPSVDDALPAFAQDQMAYGRALLDYGVQLGRRWARP